MNVHGLSPGSLQLYWVRKFTNVDLKRMMNMICIDRKSSEEVHITVGQERDVIKVMKERWRHWLSLF